MAITELSPAEPFGLTLDHFYGIVKQSVGNLAVDQRLQLQATAIPLGIQRDAP